MPRPHITADVFVPEDPELRAVQLHNDRTVVALAGISFYFDSTGHARTTLSALQALLDPQQPLPFPADHA